MRILLYMYTCTKNNVSFCSQKTSSYMLHSSRTLISANLQYMYNLIRTHKMNDMITFSFSRKCYLGPRNACFTLILVALAFAERVNSWGFYIRDKDYMYWSIAKLGTWEDLCQTRAEHLFAQQLPFVVAALSLIYKCRKIGSVCPF